MKQFKRWNFALCFRAGKSTSSWNWMYTNHAVRRFRRETGDYLFRKPSKWEKISLLSFPFNDCSFIC